MSVEMTFRRMKMLYAVERPPEWEDWDNDMEEIDDFHVKFPLRWDIMREARRERARREGVKFGDREWGKW